MFGSRTARRATASVVLDIEGKREETPAEHSAPEPAHNGSSVSRIKDTIKTLVSIAAAQGSSISSTELFLLLPPGLFDSSTDLESFLEYDAGLGLDILVRDGQVTLKGLDHLARGRPAQVSLSAERVEIAQAFSDRLVSICPWIDLVSISGSTAYAAGKPNDDVDFYIVTRRNRLWVTLLIAMLAARFHKTKNPDSPQFCFNRIQEDDECRNSFKALQDPLFAREVLSLRILGGHRYYIELVKSASWMERLFPGLVHEVLTSAPVRTIVGDQDREVWSIVNGIAFVILPPYLALVGAWRNRRLARQGRHESRFRTVIRRGFFAYESRKYDLLRDIYRKVF